MAKTAKHYKELYTARRTAELEVLKVSKCNNVFQPKKGMLKAWLKAKSALSAIDSELVSDYGIRKATFSYDGALFTKCVTLIGKSCYQNGQKLKGAMYKNVSVD